MVSFKKYLTHLLKVLLFVSLLGGVFALSINDTFSKPDNIKTWLKESKFYDNFAAYAIDKAGKSVENVNGAGGISTNPAVSQAAKTAFPPQLLEDSVNKFLDGNYAWLQGKTDKPEFSIDLKQAKETFAVELGKQAGVRFTSLPLCTPKQVAQLQYSQSANLLAVPCRPPNLNSQAVMDQVTQETRGGKGFLKYSVITPETINQASTPEARQTAQSQPQRKEPYYQSFSQAPSLYRAGQSIPLIAGIVALLCLGGMILLPDRKRSGLRPVAIVLVIVGFILLIIKLVADVLFAKLEDTIVNASGAGQLQQSFVGVLHKAENNLVAFNMTFGVVFLLTAAGIFVYLHQTRPPKAASPDTQAPGSASTETSSAGSTLKFE